MTHSVGSRHWLAAETARLIDFARGSVHPAGGFGWLDTDGSLRADHPRQLWINCRMTHVFALATLLAWPESGRLVEQGVDALSRLFADPVHGGWYASVDASGEPLDSAKSAYDHTFVLLAAASATAVGAQGGAELLDQATALFLRRFWDDEAGMVLENWDRAWTTLEPYRGINSNMHATEAFLAVHALTGDTSWRDRASRVVTRVFDWGRANSWRIPEHFDVRWQALPHYNRDDPAHQFRPYGATIGHALEWSRLALHLRAAVGAQAPDQLLADSRALFNAAICDGWAVDGADGFVYTVDWEGRPVVRDRMHWVVAEAIAAAAALFEVTGEAGYEHWQHRLWDYSDRYLIDHHHGSWRHQLGPENEPAASVWAGKPDVYHALQATLLPGLPLSGGMMSSLARSAVQL